MADKTETTNQTNTTPSKLHFQCYPKQSASLWDTAKKALKIFGIIGIPLNRFRFYRKCLKVLKYLLTNCLTIKTITSLVVIPTIKITYCQIYCIK